MNVIREIRNSWNEMGKMSKDWAVWQSVAYIQKEANGSTDEISTFTMQN